MKKKIFTLAVLLSIFAASLLLAQPSVARKQFEDSSAGKHKFRVIMTVRNAPAYTIQFSGNYDYGVFELSGNNNGDFDSEELVNGENFGVRHGIGANLTFKVPLHEKGNIRLNVMLFYNRFSSSFSKVLTSNDASQYARYQVFSIGAGLENNFTPSYKIKTYISGGIIASLISGQLGIYDESGVFGNVSVKPALRLGITLSSGLEYMLSNNMGLNFGFRFTHANVWLKNSEVSTDPNEVYLNDKRVSPKLPYSGFKQFAWGSFFLGMDLYFGVSEKKYIYPKN
jgi:opacity protein-like surface antigen